MNWSLANQLLFDELSETFVEYSHFRQHHSQKSFVKPSFLKENIMFLMGISLRTLKLLFCGKYWNFQKTQLKRKKPLQKNRLFYYQISFFYCRLTLKVTTDRRKFNTRFTINEFFLESPRKSK